MNFLISATSRGILAVLDRSVWKGYLDKGTVQHGGSGLVLFLQELILCADFSRGLTHGPSLVRHGASQ